MLHLRYLAGFKICFDFKISQSSEYAMVLNMSGLHNVPKKTFRNRCYDSILNMPWVLNMLVCSHHLLYQFYLKVFKSWFQCLDMLPDWIYSWDLKHCYFCPPLFLSDDLVRKYVMEGWFYSAAVIFIIHKSLKSFIQPFL